MFFPEFLYQLSARDQQVTWLDPRIARGDTLLAAAAVTAVAITVPTGLVLVLQNASLEADPGAAQNVTESFFELLTPDAATGVRITQDRTALAANVIGHLNWSGSILVPPNWQVRGAANFNAAAAANRVIADCIGILLPVGNIQRV